MVERPLSPHLQVYKPQITSVLSITHRMTGVFLSLGALLLAWWLMSIAAGPQVYAELMQHVNAWYGKCLIIAFVFSLYYHLANGIRHLFWDIGVGLEIESAYRSGYLVLMVTVIMTGVTLYFGLFSS